MLEKSYKSKGFLCFYSQTLKLLVQLSEVTREYAVNCGKRAKKEVAATRQHCYQPHPRSATNPALACVSELDSRLSLGSFTITYVESGVNIFF